MCVKPKVSTMTLSTSSHQLRKHRTGALLVAAIVVAELRDELPLFARRYERPDENDGRGSQEQDEPVGGDEADGDQQRASGRIQRVSHPLVRPSRHERSIGRG